MRRRRARGEIDHDEFAAAEDRAIEEAIRLQERVGLKLATDGEFRRRSYHSYFYGRLGDVVPDVVDRSDAGSGRGAQPQAVIRSKLKWRGPIHVARFRVPARAHARGPEDHASRPVRGAFPRRQCGGDGTCL
jgi:5-methyltetrahydropteroyltriglutamate--homocysteine methyltransferase